MDKAEKDDARKRKLAAQLRANLQKRKVQARARRAGDADERAQGIAAAKPGDADASTGD